MRRVDVKEGRFYSNIGQKTKAGYQAELIIKYVSYIDLDDHVFYVDDFGGAGHCNISSFANWAQNEISKPKNWQFEEDVLGFAKWNYIKNPMLKTMMELATKRENYLKSQILAAADKLEKLGDQIGAEELRDNISNGKILEAMIETS